MIGWLIAGLLATLAIFAVVIYNRLVRDRERCHAGWSDIGVQLKRRHDLIPKLVDAVSQYAAYEKSTLARANELRSQASMLRNSTHQGAVEKDLSQRIGSIFALQEAYPELNADQNFLQLQADISAVEVDIQFARRYYNGAVRNLNTRIDSFPDLLLAHQFKFRPAEYFEFEESQKA